MSASMYESPRPLAPALQAKLRRIEIAVAKKQRIQRIRIALQNIVDQLERDREVRRRSALGAGDQMPRLFDRSAKSRRGF